jgi:hypothetical protein
MLEDIVSVQPIGGYRLRIRFEDNVEGDVDISEIVRFEGVFEPLQKLEVFEKVFVNSDLGTICWPNGADLAPETLRNRIQIPV